MNDIRKLLSEKIAPGLKRAGFTKKGFNWILKSNGWTTVFNIQSSAWGNGIYFNLGLFLPCRSAPKSLAFNKADIYGRLEDIVPAQEKELKCLMEYAANDQLDHESLEKLGFALTQHVFPTLVSLNDVESFKLFAVPLKDIWFIKPKAEKLIT